MPECLPDLHSHRAATSSTGEHRRTGRTYCGRGVRLRIVRLREPRQWPGWLGMAAVRRYAFRHFFRRLFPEYRKRRGYDRPDLSAKSRIDLHLDLDLDLYFDFYPGCNW